MSDTRTRNFSLLLMLTLGLAGASCTSGPTPPQIGTPAFYWQAARETFAAGDYLKANEHLEQLCKSDNEYTARAQPWNLILASGMAQGFMDLADKFEAGAGANKDNPILFRRQTTDYRRMAERYGLNFAETFERFLQTHKEPNIALAFTYPTGNPAPVPQAANIANGVLLPPAELESVQKHILERAVLLATCRAVGAPDDVAKTQEIFKPGNVQAPRDVFVLAIANALYEDAQLYTSQKLNHPQRLAIFCDRSLQALQTIPETKQTKELRAKIQKLLKSVKAA